MVAARLEEIERAMRGGGLGLAWDPNGKGKTAVRGAIGLFHESVLNGYPAALLLRCVPGSVLELQVRA